MKTIPEQIQCKCIHFNGLMSKTCRAGIDYDAVKVPGVKPFKFPCLKNTEMSGGSCAKAEFLSEEEAAKKAKEIEDEGTKTLLAMFAVKEHIKTSGITKGKIVCPSCGGDLHYTQTPSNGHTWGKCKCGISWME